MRKCLVVEKKWQAPLSSQPHKGEWVAQPPVDAWFHQFVTETDGDNTSAMAIVEYAGGSVDTIPLSWLVLKPYEPIQMMEGVATLSAQEYLPKEVTDRMLVCMEEALISFQVMCRDIPNQVRR